ncbi:MAG: patatin-like phospholipase family protein [Mycobacterium sp.]|nr:patatin-like phospholipase family protein [Mycobacterium sp.]
MSGSGVTEPERFWDPEHPVLKILRRRRETGSKPGARDDSAKVALAVAGGGMRGVISGAMCAQLNDAGFNSAFDVVYGGSSGAINAAYFVTQPQRSWHPLSIYFDDLATRDFVRFSRALLGGSIMNLDYVFDEVLRSAKALDYQAAIESAVSLVVSVTDVDARDTVAFRDFATADELESILRASVHLPSAVKGVAEFGGQRLLDGALLAPLPFRLAIDDGCTHVLSLSTFRIQKSQKLRKRHPAWGYPYSLYLEQIQPGLGAAFLNGQRQRLRDQEWLMRRRCSSSVDGPHVLDLAPLPWMKEIKLHDRDPHVVLERCRAAYAVSHCATEGISTDWLRDGLVRAVPKMMISHGDISAFSARPGLPGCVPGAPSTPVAAAS